MLQVRLPANSADREHRECIWPGLPRTETVPGAHSAEELCGKEEEGVFFPNGSADAESHDVLQVHVPLQSRHLIADLVGIEAWRLVEEEGVPVELIRPAPGHHLNVAPAGPSRISGCIAGQYPEFREHVRIRPNGRKVATGRTGFVDIHTVQSIVPGAIPRTVHVNPLAAVVADDNARLKIDELKRVSPPITNNGEFRNCGLILEVAEVAGGAGLHNIGRSHNVHIFTGCANLQSNVDRRGLPDRQYIGLRIERLETLGLYPDGVASRDHAFEGVVSGRRCDSCMSNVCGFVDCSYLGATNHGSG